MLVDCENYQSVTAIKGNAKTVYCYNMFNAQPVVDASNLKLPFSEVTVGSAFRGMFYNCTSLRYAPKEMLFSKIGYMSCYQMFSGCTALISAPKMTSTKITYASCLRMFENCSSLQYVPEGLKIAGFFYNSGDTTLYTQGCEYMFNGCTALKNVVPITATTFVVENATNKTHSAAFNCMYYKCTALRQVNKLYFTDSTYPDNAIAYMYRQSTTTADVYIRVYTSARSGYTKAYKIPWSGTTAASVTRTPVVIDDASPVNKSINLNTTYYINDDVEIV